MKRDEKWGKNRKFPLFISLNRQRVLVVGGGSIATRRIRTLLNFEIGSIEVVAPRCSDEILGWAEEGLLHLHSRTYESGDIEGMFFVLAATDSREVNQKIYKECAGTGIWVNVCDDASLCDFHFPGVICQEELTIGINASGKNHRKAKLAREKIEKYLEGDVGYE